jgi:regulator of replication initiation timing
MDKVKILESIQAIGACEDDVARRDLLAQLQDDLSADYDRFSEIETQNGKLTTDNESLRDANMKLFLRIGTHSEEKQDETEKKPEEKLTWENLFNEKGEIV